MDTFVSILIIAGIVCSSAIGCAVMTHCFSSILARQKFSYKCFFTNLLIELLVGLLNQMITLYSADLNILKPVFSTIIFFFIAKNIYNLNGVKSILCAVSSILFTAIWDILYSIILMSIGYSLTDFSSSALKYFMFSLIFNVTQTILPLFLYKILQKKMGFNNTEASNNVIMDYKYITYQLLIILICLLPSIFLMFSKNYNYPISFLLVNIIQISIATCIGFIYTNKRIIHKHTEQELENTKLYNTALATINENVRGFKHDMGNIVQSINGYISTNNLEGVREYCQGLLKGFNDINILSVLSPRIINNPAIYGIVVSKILLAREKGITLTTDINCDVEQINFPKFELSRILGILLDNAIEACETSNEKKLTLNMFYDHTKKSDVIIVGNSVKDTSKIDIIKMFDKNYSTKKKPSGFGLYEIIKFLRSYNKGDILPNIDYEKSFFTQTLLFEKQSNI